MSEPSVTEEKQLSDTNNNDNESNSGSGTGGEDPLICRDYQRGVCNRGGKCKFSHPDGLGKEMESSPMICRDYQNGKCSRSTCKYLHISNDEEKMYLRTGQLPMRRPPMYSPPRAPPAYGGFPTRANRSDPICKDFLNSKCTRGSGCKYRHAYEDEKSHGPPGDHGPPGAYGYNDYSRKRRRDSYGEGDFAHLKEEHDMLRRQVADLQKQVSDLKATNEVLLEQNARYRNQAASSPGPSYPSTPSTANPYTPSTVYPSTPSSTYPATATPAYIPNPSYGASYAAKLPTATPTPQPTTNYTASYAPTGAYNGNSTATYTTTSSYTSSNPSYTSTANYGAPTSSDSSTYSSTYPTGTGYIKFG